MKRFKFRLQTVLEYRERIRDDCKAEVVKANQALVQAQDELQRLLQLEIENILSIQQVTHVSAVQLNAQIAQGLWHRIANQRAVIVLREQDVTKAMEIYLEASKELKAVTTLKERKLQEYNQHIAEVEAAYLDELATQRAARQHFSRSGEKCADNKANGS